MELKLELSSARNWISGLKGKHDNYAENRQTCETGKNPSTGFEPSSSKKGIKISQVSFPRGKTCCGEKSKGKAVLRDSEVEELNERLKVLEEETEMMKVPFFWSLEERKVMMNEISKQFQLLRGCLKPRTQVIEESSNANPFEDWRVRKSLPEIISQYQNPPPFITRELKANALAFQEPSGHRGHVKFHHD